MSLPGDRALNGEIQSIVNVEPATASFVQLSAFAPGFLHSERFDDEAARDGLECNSTADGARVDAEEVM